MESLKNIINLNDFRVVHFRNENLKNNVLHKTKCILSFKKVSNNNNPFELKIKSIFNDPSKYLELPNSDTIKYIIGKRLRGPRYDENSNLIPHSVIGNYKNTKKRASTNTMGSMKTSKRTNSKIYSFSHGDYYETQKYNAKEVTDRELKKMFSVIKEKLRINSYNDKLNKNNDKNINNNIFSNIIKNNRNKNNKLQINDSLNSSTDQVVIKKKDKKNKSHNILDPFKTIDNLGGYKLVDQILESSLREQERSLNTLKAENNETNAIINRIKKRIIQKSKGHNNFNINQNYFKTYNNFNYKKESKLSLENEVMDNLIDKSKRNDCFKTSTNFQDTEISNSTHRQETEIPKLNLDSLLINSSYFYKLTQDAKSKLNEIIHPNLEDDHSLSQKKWQMSLRRPTNFIGIRKKILNVESDQNPKWLLKTERYPEIKEKIYNPNLNYKVINNNLNRINISRDKKKQDNYIKLIYDTLKFNDLKISGKKLVDAEEENLKTLKGKKRLLVFKNDPDEVRDINFYKNFEFRTTLRSKKHLKK